MRTTLKIDDELLKESKIVAAKTGKTVAAVFKDALRESLLRQRRSETREPFVVPVFHGTGPAPGVDIDDDWGSIKALLDDEDAQNCGSQSR